MTLTKGDLVMTEHELAWYLKYCPRNRQYLTKESNHVQLVNNGHYVFVDVKPIPATRAQVEAKITEMGWVWEDAYVSWGKPSNLYKVLENIPNNWGLIVPSTIVDTDFDTAPEQLAEAILVTRLLNATKY